MSEQIQKTFKVHEGRLAWFQDKMAKLAKRAARIGVVAPSFTMGEVEIVQEVRREESGEDLLTGRSTYTEIPVITRYYPVTISGEAPKYAGWTIVATLQVLEGGEVLVRSISEQPLPLRYRDAKTAFNCEHCNASRRRSETFVVVSEAGEHKQVGRQCIRDFLGHADPEKLARQAEYLMEAMSLGEGGGFGDAGGSLPIDYFMAYVAATMNAFGWCSRSKAKEEDGRRQPTANIAMEHAAPSKEKLRDRTWVRLEVTATDKERAEIALDWAMELSDEEVAASDYLHNLRAIARTNMVEHRTAGYAASIIIACEKAQDRVRAAKARPVSTYVGTVGKREVFTVTLEKVIEISTDWGVSYLHCFADAAGNEIKWFGSSKIGREGKTLAIKATVKKHEEYKGRKQTMVSRAAEYVECPKKNKKNTMVGDGIVAFFSLISST